MNTIIKKILLAAFALVAMPVMAHAQVFNTSSDSSNTVYICNHTKGTCAGGATNNAWSTSVSADAGDLISVKTVYENMGTSMANNVSLRLSPQSASNTTSVTFNGSVLQSGRSIASGTARLSISSSQSLSLVTTHSNCNAYACWYDNGTGPYAMASGKISEFFGSGILVGDVGGDEYGEVIAYYKVSNNSVIIPPVYDSCSLSLSANPTSINSGDTSTLSWYSSNCSNMYITPITGNNVNTSGSMAVRPSVQTTYTLYGYGTNGSAQQSSVTIYVNNYVQPTYNNCTIYTFAPDKTYLSRGENTNLRWSTNANYVVITPIGVTNGAASSSAYVSPSTTTTYYMTAYCSNGYSQAAQASTTVSVANAVTSNMQVTTTNATSIRTGSAQLNGIAAPNNNGTATTWFEYGTTGALGGRTNAQSVAAANNSYFNDYVTGLAPNTWYYYRTALQNNSGTVYGDILRFKTIGGAVEVYVPPVKTVRTVQIVNNTVTAQSAPSLLELKVNSQYDRMCVNGDMQYVVTYRNISGITLKDTVLRITHPKELMFLASTQGRYEIVDRVVTVDIGDVAPNQSGIVTLTLKVNSDAIRGNLAVTTATVVYTNPNTRGQEDATAYSLINVSDDCPTASTLGANAFGTSFLPNTLLEWLLLILVILGLIILARQLYKKSHQV